MGLSEIQAKLKAPKNQYNSFGKYHYRSCEDILEAVKPLLLEHNAALTITDEIAMIGTRFYVRAIATLNIKGGEQIMVTAYAREEESKKGMDGSQVTGAASSYARKYALNGLFLIDDTKDADTMDNTKDTSKKTSQQESVSDFTPVVESNIPPTEDKYPTMKKEIMNWLVEIYGNIDDAENELERLTKWVKDGKDMPGKRDVFKLNTKENTNGQSQTSVVHHQVHEQHNKWLKSMEAQDADAT
ncbi:MAG: ERF family protein [Smithella sp.]